MLRLERRPVGGGPSLAPGPGISNAFVQVSSAKFSDGSAIVSVKPGVPFTAIPFAVFSATSNVEVGVAVSMSGPNVVLVAAVPDGTYTVHVFYVVQ